MAATGAFARELRAADTQGEDYPTVQALRFMGRLVSERSGGRHQIKVFHSRQLGEEKETLEQTRAGAIELNRTNVALLGNIVPSMNVLAMPFLFRSIEHMQKVLDGPIGAECLAASNLRVCGAGILRFGRAIDLQQRPPDPLAGRHEGLGLRVQQSEQMSEMMRSLGANPVELPYGQVLTGLVTKLIDGAENNWPSFVTTDHYKHAGYYTLTEHTMSPEVLVMSHKVWMTLRRKTGNFRDAALRSSQFMREKWRDLEERSQQAGGGRRRDHRDGYRQEAVRTGHGQNLRQSAARSRGRATDRTHSQGAE